MCHCNHNLRYNHNSNRNYNHTIHPIDNNHYNRNYSFDHNHTIGYNPNYILSYIINYNHISCIQYHSANYFIKYFQHHYSNQYFTILILNYQSINILSTNYSNKHPATKHPHLFQIIPKYLTKHHHAQYQDYLPTLLIHLLLKEFALNFKFLPLC